MNARQQVAQQTLVAADRALGQRDFSSALGNYNRVFEMGLESWPMHVNAAQCHKRLGDLDSAFKHFDRAFMIKRQPDIWSGTLPPQPRPMPNEVVTTVFVKNLQEQLEYLVSKEHLPWYPGPAASELEAFRRMVELGYGACGSCTVDLANPWMSALLRTAPHRSTPGAMDELLSSEMHISEIPLSGGEGDRFFVIDNLFNQPTLDGLLEQLLNSTIWFDSRAQRSYLGAHLHDGLATPFMLGVTKTLRDVVTTLVGNVAVAQLWAFRYLANSKGIDIHADQGDWNLNVWPISEEHLIETGDQGGMTIYDLRIADDIPFDQYNSQPDLNRERIERAKAVAHVVPYRGNRAVVFPSKYLHKTNAASFSDRFEGRRINVTLMADKA